MPHIPRKRFGQNFLHDEQVIEQIISAFRPAQDQTIVEIGPGQGALTRKLVQYVNILHVIEIDRDLVSSLLKNTAFTGKLKIHNRDVLDFDFSSLGSQLRIIGNLPYNISTPLLFHLTGYINSIQDMLFMLQEEVVDRICADKGNKSYGRLSVIIQSQFDVDKLFTIGRHAFNPQPRVDSAIIRMVPDLHKYHIQNRMQFEKLVKLAFGQRRKKIKNTLETIFNVKDIINAGIDPDARAEELSIENFISLYRILLKNKAE